LNGGRRDPVKRLEWQREYMRTHPEQMQKNRERGRAAADRRRRTDPVMRRKLEIYDQIDRGGYTLTQEQLAAIAALPIHPISGYEWECEVCKYDWDHNVYRDPGGRETEHGADLISRSAILGVPSV
jgi:hypothetical protein